MINAKTLIGNGCRSHELLEGQAYVSAGAYWPEIVEECFAAGFSNDVTADRENRQLIVNELGRASWTSNDTGWEDFLA